MRRPWPTGGYRPPKKYFFCILCAWWLLRHSKNIIVYFNARTVHLVQFVIQTNKCKTSVGLDKKLINLIFIRRKGNMVKREGERNKRYKRYGKRTDGKGKEEEKTRIN
jgi:hypothetical protein